MSLLSARNLASALWQTFLNNEINWLNTSWNDTANCRFKWFSGVHDYQQGFTTTHLMAYCTVNDQRRNKYSIVQVQVLTQQVQVQVPSTDLAGIPSTQSLVMTTLQSTDWSADLSHKPSKAKHNTQTNTTTHQWLTVLVIQYFTSCATPVSINYKQKKYKNVTITASHILL